MHVVPVAARAEGVRPHVPAVGVERGHVDAADEGDAAIDDERLLVLAVTEALALVQPRAYLGVGPHEHLSRLFDVAIGELAGDGARPDQDAHVDLIGLARYQGEKGVRAALTVARIIGVVGGPDHAHVRRHEPRGHEDRFLGVLHRLVHRAHGVLSVYERGQTIAVPGRSVRGKPAVVTRPPRPWRGVVVALERFVAAVTPGARGQRAQVLHDTQR